MTINEAVRSGARDRMVSGDDISHAFAAGAEYYPAPSWPKTQPLRASIWRQLASELNAGMQYGGIFRNGQTGSGSSGSPTPPPPDPGLTPPTEIAGSLAGGFPLNPTPAWYPNITSPDRNNIFYSP